MSSNGFTKTAAQVERGMLDTIESIDRSLDSSSSESDRKGQLIFGAFMSILVFVGILIFQHFTASKRDSAPTSTPLASAHALSARDVSLISGYLDRIDGNVNGIVKVKQRAAPSLAIDGNVTAISNSVADVRRILSVEKVPASDRGGAGQ